MSDEERVYLTVSEALELLPTIHVFSNPVANILIGADWDIGAIADHLGSAEKIEIGGPECRYRGHGLVIWEDGQPLFVECSEEVISEFLQDRNVLPK